MSSLALITGASRGIGAAAAAKFLAAGWQVVSLSRTPCPVRGVEHVAIDLADPIFAEHCAEQLEQLRHRVAAAERTSLIHNAAVNPRGALASLELDDMQRAMQVNVVAPAMLSRALIGAMTRGSSLVFVGSTLSEKAIANATAYVTSKHALVGLMRAATQDLAGTGIHCVCVCPGFTDTEMLREHAVGVDLEALMEELVCHGRLIRPDEIADILVLAATNPVLNGAIVHANLGQIER